MAKTVSGWIVLFALVVGLCAGGGVVAVYFTRAPGGLDDLSAELERYRDSVDGVVELNERAVGFLEESRPARERVRSDVDGIAVALRGAGAFSDKLRAIGRAIAQSAATIDTYIEDTERELAELRTASEDLRAKLEGLEGGGGSRASSAGP